MKVLLALALLAALSACGDRRQAAPDAARAPAAAKPDAGGAGQTDRFIVCPGNPRCPKNQQGRPPGKND